MTALASTRPKHIGDSVPCCFLNWGIEIKWFCGSDKIGKAKTCMGEKKRWCLDCSQTNTIIHEQCQNLVRKFVLVYLLVCRSRSLWAHEFGKFIEISLTRIWSNRDEFILKRINTMQASWMKANKFICLDVSKRARRLSYHGTWLQG